MKTVVLIEDSWIGHRPTYLKFFSKILLELGCQVNALCPQPTELQSWISQYCYPKPEQFQAFEFHKPRLSQSPLKSLHPFFNASNFWQNARVAVDNISTALGKLPDLVFFNFLDSYLAPCLTYHLLDQIFPYRWSGLYLHPRHFRLHPNLWSLCPNYLRPHSALYSSRCLSVALLDEGITDKFKSQIPGKAVIDFPDITDESEPDLDFPLLKQIQEKAHGRKIVGLLGSQSKRKGIFTFLEVAQRMKTENLFFLLAGNLYPKSFTKNEHTRLLNFIGLNLSNCFFYWELIPEKRFNSLVSICEILFAAYEDFPHSSNMLNKAANFSTPIIVSKNFCMAERVEKYRLGLTINEGNVDECIKAIRHLSNSVLNNHDFQGYKRTHSIDNLYSAFQAVLNSL